MKIQMSVLTKWPPFANVIFLNKYCCILIWISQNFDPDGPTDSSTTVTKVKHGLGFKTWIPEICDIDYKSVIYGHLLQIKFMSLTC